MKPLTIAISRPTEELTSLSQALSCFPALQIIGIPLIQIVHLAPPPPAIQPNWVFFTSQHGVRSFFAHPENPFLTKNASIKWGVVGEKTAQALATHHITPDFIPTTFSAQHAAREWADQQTLHNRPSLSPQSILWPCSTLAQDTFPKQIQQAGHHITPWVTYQTTPRTQLSHDEKTSLRQAYCIGLTSPSCVTSLQHNHLTQHLAPKGGWVTIGPSTRQALEKALQNTVAIQTASPHTLEGMANTLKRQVAQWITQSIRQGIKEPSPNNRTGPT